MRVVPVKPPPVVTLVGAFLSVTKILRNKARVGSLKKACIGIGYPPK